MIALNDNEDDDEGIDAYIMPLGEEARDLGMQISAVLRANGFSVDMDYAGRGFKGQFKSADRFKATYSLLLGEDEVKGEYVNIRDNKTKEQEQVPFEDIVSYLEKGLGL